MPSRKTLANAIRALSMDAVEKAASGHPGMPMGMADIAEVLWNDHLNHNPSNPKWWNRDRFVLSNGHGSMLLYSLLHLTGYDLSIDDLTNFRQMHSKTAGHPEYLETPGVETTTGPLGQGLANAVGMALAERVLADRFNQEDFSIVDHRTYAFIGDGCLMEGISHEVCSLAGTLRLGKLIVLYDDNGISIDGDVENWFTDDTSKRFEAYGWQVIRNVDGHDAEEINTAIATAKEDISRPSIICCRTTIGYGSPNKQGKSSSHGAPLGKSEIQLARENLDWPYPAFEIPDELYSAWNACDRGQAKDTAWSESFERYKQAHPLLAEEFERRMRGDLPEFFQLQADKYIAQLQAEASSVASRKASQNCLNAYGPMLPELIGGSADLAGSNNTIWSGSQDVNKQDRDGNYIYFGVREFGMSAIQNGLALHGGFIPYGATFLVFSDYSRNALRMSALIPTRAIHVFTHDSIGLGEDGPTHQPIEHLASLRLIPNMSLWRPCDCVESAVAWKAAIERHDGPSALIFTRQTVAHQQRTVDQVSAIKKGGYVLRREQGKLDAIIIATGSEVQLAVDAAIKLSEQGLGVRVVSMPNTNIFDLQDSSYKRLVLGDGDHARVAIEAGVSDCWYKYVGLNGKVIGIDRFGASAPAPQLFEYFGFTVDNLIATINELTQAD